MRELFKDKEHLFRVAALFVGGFVVFLVLRGLLVPTGFGEYGHYRAGALKDATARQPVFAGRPTCEGPCHDDAVEARRGSKHAGISCEACHGPQAEHASAEDPAKAKPKRPDPKAICLVCHMENVAKPPGFPQVNPKEHLKDVGGEGKACSDCHRPHHPEISSEPAPARASAGIPATQAQTAGSEVKP